MIFKPNRSLFACQMASTESPLSIQGGKSLNITIDEKLRIPPLIEF